MSRGESNNFHGLLHRLEGIYQNLGTNDLSAVATRILARVESASSPSDAEPQSRWDETRCLLISYADSLSDGRKSPIACLGEFVETHLDEVIDGLHILPFFPSTGDDGFSVMDYRAVDPRLGSWKDITKISASKKIMADVILNHASKSSNWFRQFVDGEAPGKDYFLSVDESFDISNVIRPREHALLQNIETAAGPRHIWCTFSEDQVISTFQTQRCWKNLSLSF